MSLYPWDDVKEMMFNGTNCINDISAECIIPVKAIVDWIRTHPNERCMVGLNLYTKRYVKLRKFSESDKCYIRRNADMGITFLALSMDCSEHTIHKLCIASDIKISSANADQYKACAVDYTEAKALYKKYDNFSRVARELNLNYKKLIKEGRKW